MRTTILFSIKLALLAFVLPVKAQKPTRIAPDNPHVIYEGRIAQTPEEAVLYWPGSSIALNFTGTSIDVDLKDQKADNFYYVFIDGKNTGKLKPDTVRRTYRLADNLDTGKHRVELYKLTESDRGSTAFFGFTLAPGGTTLTEPAPKTRKIEFYGNSITCGLAVEDASGKDNGGSIFENNYLSYAAITARNFNAQASYIAISGIGIQISWSPRKMPDLYDRLNPDDPNSKWDFRRYTPDIVVVNLLQNDSWLVKRPDHAEFKRVFGTKKPDEAQIISTYADFIRAIRNRYPNAEIICALGNMDATREGSPWPGYIQKAVESLKDQKMHTVFFPYKKTSAHPLVAEQQAMADQLTAFIRDKIKW